MTLFHAISVSATGVYAHRKWMDAISDNIANINNASRVGETPFRERFVLAQAQAYGTGLGGVQVPQVMFGTAEGRMVYEPQHPLADRNGNVMYPAIELHEQMPHLLMAQRGYQANLSVVERAKTAYEAAIQLGRGA